MSKTLFVLAALVCQAAASPNFSGHWKLNAEKSKLDEPFQEERTIEQKDPEISVHVKASVDGEEQESTTKFTTDGKETKTMVDGDPLFTTAHWDGDALVCDSTSIGDTDTTELHDRWSLSEDGKLLTIQRRVKVGTDVRDMVMVFDLKS